MSPEGTPYIQPADPNKEWETPHNLFDKLHQEFKFTVDPCCRVEHHSAQEILKKKRDGKIITPPWPDSAKMPSGVYEDGLTHPWTDNRGQPGRVFMNSPYGLALRVWTDRAVKQVEEGHALFVVGLVPSKTDTQWWQRNVIKRVHLYRGWRVIANDVLTEVRFLPARLTFHGAPDPAGFASAIVIWRR